MLHSFPSLCGNSFLHSWQARALSLATGPQWLGCLTATEIEPYLNLWPGTEALLQAATGLVHPRSTRSHSSMGTSRLDILFCNVPSFLANISTVSFRIYLFTFWFDWSPLSFICLTNIFFTFFFHTLLIFEKEFLILIVEYLLILSLICVSVNNLGYGKIWVHN